MPSSNINSPLPGPHDRDGLLLLLLLLSLERRLLTQIWTALVWLGVSAFPSSRADRVLFSVAIDEDLICEKLGDERPNGADCLVKVP